MDVLMICIFACLSLLIGFFIAYSVTTKRIIQDQEKEIAKLTTENMRLRYKSALSKLNKIAQEVKKNE